MMTLQPSHVRRLAEQLLIRQNPQWALPEARNLVVWTNASLGISLCTNPIRSIVTAAYRVGRTLDLYPGLAKSCKWQIESVRGSLRATLSRLIGCDDYEEFIECLARCVKNNEPYNRPIADWVEEINRMLRQIAMDDVFPSLEPKLALGVQLAEMIDRRREELVLFIEQELDVNRNDVATALASQIARSEPTTTDRVAQSSRSSRLTDGEFAALLPLVDPKEHERFREWFASLPPLAQRAAERRLLQLAVEPLVHTLWVKRIVSPHRPDLLELRVVSEGTHYRLLFHGQPGEPPLVVGFGLRRDLDRLIMAAESRGR